MARQDVVDSIASGETDTVVNHLLKNSFGEKLQSIHSRNSSIGFNTSQMERGNELDISDDLPEDIEITVEYLKSLANPKVINIYEVETNFNAMDSRHMTV